MTHHSQTRKPGVLIVDDHFRALKSLRRLISPVDFSPLWVPNEEEGLRVLKDQPENAAVIIIDLKSSAMGGGGFLNQARQVAPGAPVLITGPLSHCLYQDGTFYQLSGADLKSDINTVLLGIIHRNGMPAQTADHEQTGRMDRFGFIIGRSRGINKVYRLIEKLRQSSATVLIHGESGTGKELVARTIHRTSVRKKLPFVAINCGAIPANLMESELFGHERGAFTTAISQRKGKFEIAGGGTLFLDEIGELDKDLQVKLLRVLQEKEFQRVGGNATIKTDVRIIAASSQDLKSAVGDGHFRDDLFYRINVVPIHIPPLQERKEDIALLLEHFMEKFAGEMKCSLPLLTEEAQTALYSYGYPGNVRELINIVERLFITCPNGQITLQDLPEEVCLAIRPSAKGSNVLKQIPEEGIRLTDVEKELIHKTLKLTDGNKQAAARMLGITRRLLYLRLAQYGL